MTTKDQIKAALLPCPFCGSEARLYEKPAYRKTEVVCSNHSCRVFAYAHDSPDKAISAWNTRSLDTAMQTSEAGNEQLSRDLKLLNDIAVRGSLSLGELLMTGQIRTTEYEVRKREVDQLHEALARVRKALQSGEGLWQPIETAPRDGTGVLVYAPYGGGFVTQSYYKEMPHNGHMWVVDCGEICPTHWMPLPQPPTAAIEAAMKKGK